MSRLERLRRDPTAQRKFWAELTRRSDWRELDTLYTNATTPEDADALARILLQHHGWRLDAAARSDRGPVRGRNEDVAAFTHDAWVVADGMGGITAGTAPALITARLIARGLSPNATTTTCTLDLDAVPEAQPVGELFLRALSEPLEPRPASRLKSAFAHAHRTVTALQDIASPRFSYKGCGATAAAMHLRCGHLDVGHIGDVRVYRLRDGVLHALTREHTLRNAYEDLQGTPLPEDQAHIAFIVVRAIGFNPESQPEAPQVDEARHRIACDDAYLIASDGLYRNVDDDRIADLMGSSESAESAAQRLVQAAIDRDANDNITALVLRVTPSW